MYHAEGCLTETEQIDLSNLFPEDYIVKNKFQEESDEPDLRVLSPVSSTAGPSTSSLSDSQLLQKILNFLVCSRDELFDEVKRLRAVDLTYNYYPHFQSSPYLPTTR